MKKVDKFLEFFLEHIEDPRISVYKKMKYGFRHYFINFTIDENPTTQNNNQSTYFQYRESMEILFDNRNKCIEVSGGEYSTPLIIEDEELLEKWSNILENIVSNDLENKVINVFEKTLSECFNKNLHRELLMKKIFKDNESI